MAMRRETAKKWAGRVSVVVFFFFFFFFFSGSVFFFFNIYIYIYIIRKQSLLVTTRRGI